MERRLSHGSPEAAGLLSAGLDAVDDAIRAQIDAGIISGAVMLVARHGRIGRVSLLGCRDLESGAPMLEDTIFRIFSMSKPVTGTAMMILRDEGLWHPDDPIERHLPEFAGVRVLTGLDASGTPLTEAAHRLPTMADLMSHQAGFAYGVAIGEPIDEIDRLYRAAKPWEADDLDDFVRRVATLPLAYQPGTRWRYSLSMDLQGAVIERLSGQPMTEFMEERIFKPLGMMDTAFHLPPEKADRAATLYMNFNDGPIRPVVNPLRPDHATPPRFPHGGAGLFSTVGDYARFAQMLLDRGAYGGRRIVSEASVREQMTNRLPDALLETRFEAGHHKFRPGFGYGYNGAVFHDPIKADLPVGRGTYHWDGAAGTWFWVDPEHDLIFVGLIQLLSWSAPPLQAMTQRLIADAIKR